MKCRLSVSALPPTRNGASPSASIRWPPARRSCARRGRGRRAHRCWPPHRLSDSRARRRSRPTPPNECPTSSRTSRPESFMNSTARTVSATLCENEPSPQSPSESPRPRLSKRSMPMPSRGQLLADPARCRTVLAEREAVGEDAPAAHFALGQIDQTRQARGRWCSGTLTRSATRLADQFWMELGHHPADAVAASRPRCRRRARASTSASVGLPRKRLRALLEDRFPADERADVGAPLLDADGLFAAPVDCRRRNRRRLEQLRDRRDDVVLVDRVVDGRPARRNLDRACRPSIISMW